MVKKVATKILGVLAILLLCAGADTAGAATTVSISPLGTYTPVNSAVPASSDPVAVTHANDLHLTTSANPVARVTGSPVTVETSVFLNSASGYGLSAYDTPTATSKAGAIDLNGQSLSLSPAGYTWVSADMASTDNMNPSYGIGSSNNVLRVYDETGSSGTLTITAQRTGGTAAGSGNFYVNGGTYLENGTLIFANGTVLPNQSTGWGPVTMGYVTTLYPATLKLNSNTTALSSLKVNNHLATLDTSGTSAGNTTTLNSLYLTENATEWNINPGEDRTIQMNKAAVPSASAYTVETNPASGSAFNIQSGTFAFNAIPTDDRTHLYLESNPVNTATVVRTKAPGVNSFGKVTVRALNYARLSFEATYAGLPGGTFTLGAVIGQPVIDIINAYQTVSVPANSSLFDVWGNGTLHVRAGSPAVKLMASTPGNTSPVTIASAAAPKSTEAQPRLSIEDGGKFMDYFSTANRTYSGLHSGPLGTGILEMPSASNVTLTLKPRAAGYTNDFRGSVPAVVSTLDLNVDTAVTATNAAFTQSLGGTNNVPFYKVTRGVLQFAKPEAIRAAATGATEINLLGGINSTVKLAYNAAGYDFSGPAATNRAMTLLLADGASLNMAPASANVGDSAASSNFIENVPAVLQVAQLNNGGANPINLVLDVSRLPSGTNRALKLLSSSNNDINGVVQVSNLQLTLVPSNALTNVSLYTDGVSTSDEYIYLVYTKSSGGGNPPVDPTEITLDMTNLISTDVTNGVLTVINSDDSRNSYNLSLCNVKIEVDENDPLSINYAEDLFTITLKEPTMHEGARVVVAFTDPSGTRTSYNAAAKIVNGKSVLEFNAKGLASGRYVITVASPSGNDPLYVGKLSPAFSYTAQGGLLFSLHAEKIAAGNGVSAYAYVASKGVPQQDVDVSVQLKDAKGTVLGSPQMVKTAADGKTQLLTFDKLKNGDYVIAAELPNYGVMVENFVSIENGNDDNDDNDDTDPIEPTGGSSGGCNAGFGGILLLALASIAPIRKMF